MDTIAVLRITEEDDRKSIGEAINHLNGLCKREFPKVGTDEHPTPWDIAHRRMDGPLDEWLKARP